jgi:hypothetical protein
VNLLPWKIWKKNLAYERFHVKKRPKRSKRPNPHGCQPSWWTLLFLKRPDRPSKRPSEFTGIAFSVGLLSVPLSGPDHVDIQIA